jgi:hypothetical protein
MWGTIGAGRIDAPRRRKRGSFHGDGRECLKLVLGPLFTFTTAISLGSVRDNTKPIADITDRHTYQYRRDVDISYRRCKSRAADVVPG